MTSYNISLIYNYSILTYDGTVVGDELIVNSSTNSTIELTNLFPWAYVVLAKIDQPIFGHSSVDVDNFASNTSSSIELSKGKTEFSQVNLVNDKSATASLSITITSNL